MSDTAIARSTVEHKTDSPGVWHHFSVEENRKADLGLPHKSTCGFEFGPTDDTTCVKGLCLDAMQKCVLCQEVLNSR